MSLHSRLRKQMPYLTPQFAGESADMFDRFKLPQDSKDPREDALMRQMQESIKPADPKWIKTPEMTDPNTGINLRAAEGIVKEESAKPLPRVHLGVSTRGLQGVDKSIAELQAAKDYDRQGLGFKITPEGVDMKPPDPHIDWKDRAKAGAKAAIISIANIRKANPDASVAEMLAGAATGGGIGLASPDTGNAMFRRAQIEDMEQRLGPQVKLAQEGQQLEALKQKPIIEAEKVRREEEYRQAQLQIQRDLEQGRTTRAEADRQLRELQLKEQERHNREQERLGQARIDKPPKGDDNTNKYEAAKGLMDDLSAQEEKARQVKDQAWTQYQTAKDQASKNPQTYSDGSPIPADSVDGVVAAKKAYDEAEKNYQSFWSKKNEAKAKMKEFEPRASSSRGADSQIKAYADKFFGGDVAAAEAAIKKQRGQ